ncbi:Neuropeptide Y receptor type 2 [Araneus ventricosus]|uniref:Neuropeptide Y receptor type 2 n=1 Tax=Araneus ventricosus TaxID=182803 RepID=A0A4Y2BHV0_ARAVE|nr:Neuropeptide Y receptor type 2 [Araneus ventricosus]
MANGLHIDHYIALAALVRTGNFSVDFFNFSGMDNENMTALKESMPPPDVITSIPAVKAFFYCLYITIFVTGICGNVLVCYVVFRNKAMHTVTNIFIANLALSDILLCTFAVPFTPLYLFMHEWVFGDVLCHLVPYAQGVSVYISAFTLMSIAIDRFFVIIHPFKPRLQVKYSLLIIVFIWVAAGCLTLPYGIFMDLVPARDGRPYCDEGWPQDSFRKAFGFTTSVMQFVIPFVIITFCYVRVCCKLRDRARSKPGSNSQRKMEMEWERTRRLNRMLISMVLIFGFSWLPLNVHNLVVDFYIPASTWAYLNGFFFLSHAVAMSSTCYNPFLYAWLNENFRKEFKTVLPFLNEARVCQFFDSARVRDPEHANPEPEPQPGCSRQSVNKGVKGPANEKATSLKYSPETDTVRMQVNADEVMTAV